MFNITHNLKNLPRILPLLVLTLPHSAFAGQIEAIWEVSLYTQTDVPTSTYEPFSVPTQFQIRTVFDDYVSATDQSYPLSSSTYFGNPSSTLIDQPLAPYISPSPYGPPIDNLGSLRAWMSTSDQSDGFYEHFSIQLYSIAQNGEGQWAHSAQITVLIEGPTRHGDGTSDFLHTPDQLWGFLSAFKDGTSSAYGYYSEYFSAWDFNSSSHIDGKQWMGGLKLISLQRLDATEVPEPAPLALLGFGVLGACLVARPRRAKTSPPTT